MQDVAESCHRDGPLCADLQFNTYTEYRWRREDNGSDRGIGGRAPKQPHRVYLRVPGLPQDAFQRCRLVRPAGKNCSLRSSWLILWAYVGLLGEPKSFSHGQDPTRTKLLRGNRSCFRVTATQATICLQRLCPSLGTVAG